MGSADLERARRWRTGLAGLIDAAITAGLGWGMRGRVGNRPARAALTLLGPSGELVREQLTSPGQRLAGVRTVDRRSGRRVVLWRTLLLVGVRAGGQLAAARLAPPAVTAEGERAQAAMRDEVERARRVHADDPAALQAALSDIYGRHRVPRPSLARAVGPVIATGLITIRLRRRLAPTLEVRARRLGSRPRR